MPVEDINEPDIYVFSKLRTQGKDICLTVEQRIMITVPLGILVLLSYFYITTIKI